MGKINNYPSVSVIELEDKLIGTRVAEEPDDSTFNFTIASLFSFFQESIGFVNNPLTNEIVVGTNTVGGGINSVTLGNLNITKTILRGTVNAANLPTSPLGLNAGDLWRNGTVINIAI